jgi:hypothetical protein
MKTVGVFISGFGWATLIWLGGLAVVDLLVFKRVASEAVLWMLAAPGLIIISVGGFLVRLGVRQAQRLPPVIE